MTNTVFAPISTQPVFINGNLAVGAKVYFYDAGTTNPRAIWTRSDASIAASNPVTTDGNGVVPPTWVSGTDNYRIVVNAPDDTLIRTIEGLEGAAAEATAASGGPDSYALTTGDILPALDANERSGFVKMNGTSIGNSGSGAHYIDDNLISLFSYLWLKVPDAYCPVAGGRGANPTDDFNAGKTMVLPDARMRCLIGLAGMGNTTSEKAADYPNAINPGFMGGLNYSLITNTNLPTHHHTGLTSGGSGLLIGATNTDGAHIHTGSTTDSAGDHTHTYNAPADVPINVGTTSTVAFKATTASANTGNAGAHTHTFSVANGSSAHSHGIVLDSNGHNHTFTTNDTGSGLGFDVMNPFIAVTFYMKT